MSDMKNIPTDIYREILLRLPAVCVFRMRAVSKGWRSVIDDPSFSKAHTNHQLLSTNRPATFIFRNSTGPPFAALYYIDADDLDDFANGLQTIPVTPLKLARSGLSRLKDLPVATCNGLLLFAPLYAKNKNRYIINWNPDGVWEIRNPLTQECLELPLPHLNTEEDLLGTGLGYDCASDDYKVVVIEVKRDKEEPSRTHVYSLRSDSWRTIVNYPTGRDFFWGGEDVQYGVFLNGALHWVSDDEIIVFDVGNEIYLQQLALPVKKWGPESTHLDVLSERLFLSCSFWDGEGEGRCWFDLWVMNDYGAKDYSWIKLFSLDTTSYYVFRPIAYMKDKSRVLLQGDNEFVWFDEKSKTEKSIEIHGISYFNYSSQGCVGSIFRLHDSCGRVEPASMRRRTRRRTWNLNMAAAHTRRLTFCVRDYYDKYDPSHDKCHRSCPNWYNHSSCLAESSKVCGTSSFDPDRHSFTLPPNICRDIFLRFPAKSVIQFRAVCKDWMEVIDDPCFVKAHTNKQLASNILIRNSTGPPFYPLYSFDLEELDFEEALQKLTVTPYEFTGTSRSFPCLVVNGCNGLMLIFDDEKLQLWNPLTDEHLELPQVLENPTSVAHAIGLGYDQATDDYKVVAIQREQEEDVYGTHVYSLRADSWKRIGDCLCDEYSNLPEGPGVFLCGALHWFSSSSCGEYILLIAFDLTTESYRQLQGPFLERGRTDLADDKRCLDVLGGCLIMTDFGPSNNYGDHYEVWVMKFYGSEDSWIKLFSLADDYQEQKFCTRGDLLRPLTYMKNKTQILLQDEIGFYLFDVESGCVKKKICIHGLTQYLSSQIFPGSIFRLHDNCGKRRTRKRIMKRPLTDTEFYFCVRDGDPYSYFDYDTDSNSDSEFYSHDSCYTIDSNWYYSSSENED